MSQSPLYHAFGVRQGYDYRKTGYVEGRVEFHVRAKAELLACPDCGHHPARRRGSRKRGIRALPISFKEVILVAEVPRCQCGPPYDAYHSPVARQVRKQLA